jgi:hypothetical protein
VKYTIRNVSNEVGMGPEGDISITSIQDPESHGVDLLAPGESQEFGNQTGIVWDPDLDFVPRNFIYSSPAGTKCMVKVWIRKSNPT